MGFIWVWLCLNFKKDKCNESHRNYKSQKNILNAIMALQSVKSRLGRNNRSKAVGSSTEKKRNLEMKRNLKDMIYIFKCKLECREIYFWITEL